MKSSIHLKQNGVAHSSVGSWQWDQSRTNKDRNNYHQIQGSSVLKSRVNWVTYLPEVLRYVILQLAFHQMPKERLHLVEHAVVWIVRVIIH